MSRSSSIPLAQALYRIESADDEAFRREGLDAKMLMQVHDELLVECPKSEADKVAKTLKREMENAVELDVPLIAETGIGDNWMDAKKQ